MRGAPGQRMIARRFLSDLRATIGLAEQLRGDQASLVFDLYSIAFFRNALALIDEALAERPELIDDRRPAGILRTVSPATAMADGSNCGWKARDWRLSISTSEPTRTMVAATAC